MAARARTVLVVGAGIGGPTLAFWLKAAGFAPTLIERAPTLRTGGYLIDFWGLGYDIAERMGLADALHCEGYQMRELRIVNARGQRVAGFGTRVFRDLTGGRYLTIARSELSRLLFEKIKDGIETIFGDEVIALEQHPDHVTVQFRNGGERRFDLVIGADGLHSDIRRLGFGAQENFERRLGYSVAAFEVADYRPRDEDVYVMFGEPGRMVGRVALRNDRTLFLFVFADDTGAPHLDLPAQKAMLRAQYGRGGWECARILAELDRVEELYFDRVSQIKMDAWSRSRIALVGDAAFCVSLLAGQGSALAMTAAYVLAGELARTDGDYASAFSSYEKLLRSYIAAKQKGAERFASAFAPRTRFGLFFRNQMINLAAMPGLARPAFGRDIVDKLKLPEYP